MSYNAEMEIRKATQGLNSLTIKPQTIRERMRDRLQTLVAEKERVENVLKLLDENPNFEKIHDAISQVGF